MKSTVIKTLAVFVMSVALFSCNKEQMALNKLEGKWKVVTIKNNGQVEEIPAGAAMYFIFDDCEADAVSCNVTVRQEFNGQTTGENTSAYVLSDDGKTITVNGDSMEITKLTKKDLTLTNSTDNDEFVFEKQ